MKDVSRREFLKTLCLGITVAALQNLPMTTAFADSAISKTKIISKSDRENLVATVARTVQVSYKIDKNTIIEVTRFTDIDGQNVTLNRSVKEDGTGELVYTKAQKTKKSKLTNQSYDVFLKLATSKSMPQTRGATVGSDVTGSQYKHIFVSNLSYCLARGFQHVGMSTVEAVNRKISWLFCFVSHGCTAAERVRLIPRRFKTEKMEFHIDKTSRQVYNRTWKQQGITAKSARMPLWIETG